MAERSELQTAEQVRRIHDALEGGRSHAVRRSLHTLHPSEIALLIESLPIRERNIVWKLIDPEDRGETLVHLPEEIREGLVEHMPVKEIVEAAKGLDTDDLADFVENLPETVTQQVLKALDAGDRARLEAVLVYPPDTAGGMMNPNIVTVRPDVTLEVVQRYLRARGRLWALTDVLFVVDRYGTYLGALPLAKILTRDSDCLVSTVMEREYESFPATLAQRDVAARFEKRDLVSAPVVDERNHLIGRITVDDVVDVIRREADHSLMSLAGLTEEEDIFAPVPQASRRRAIWLGINLATAFLAAWVVGLFQATIEQVVALAVMMPIVASMGGIGGSQTLTLMIRGLALGQIGSANTRALLRKEVLIGFINGALWALTVATIAILWFGKVKLGFVVGFAMLANQLNGAFTGVWLPLLLKRMGIDPALAGSVILTTFTDVGGFFALLGLGALIL